jgi:hypothetical protein
VGHYAFGGRTGGSVIIYGLLFLVLGLFFGKGFNQVVGVFPLPILGVLLLFEGVSLMLIMRDMADSKADLSIVILVGLMANGLPYGYAVGIVIGTALAYLVRRYPIGLTK